MVPEWLGGRWPIASYRARAPVPTERPVPQRATPVQATNRPRQPFGSRRCPHPRPAAAINARRDNMSDTPSVGVAVNLCVPGRCDNGQWKGGQRTRRGEIYSAGPVVWVPSPDDGTSTALRG